MNKELKELYEKMKVDYHNAKYECLTIGYLGECELSLEKIEDMVGKLELLVRDLMVIYNKKCEE